ncbi:MAG: serine protease, partial [Acidimicrobiales bacterium]
MTSPLTFPSPPDSSGPASRGRVVAVVVVGLLVMGALAIVLFSGGDDDTGSDDAVTSDTSPDDASDTSDADTTGEDGADDAGGDTTGEDGANDSTDPLPVGPTTGELARATVQLIQLEADGAFGCFSGSGSVVSPEGRILTNAHVVWNDPTCPYDLMGVMITRSADEPPELAYIADVIGFDDRLDLAVLQITTDLGGVPVDELALPFVITGDSGSVQLGDPLRILGYPGIGGDTITFTEGAVSGFVSEQGISDTRAWIKTDATIAGGNSGGMAVNEAGELIGVPTQAGAGDAATTDCRVIEDTNGDGSIDDNDSCIPIGGFINGLRPVNLAAELLSGEGLASLDPVTPSGPVGGFDPESVLIEQLLFTDSIVDDQPVGTVGSLARGATDLCVHW